MKRTLLIILAAILSVSLILTGCAGNKPAPAEQKPASTAAPATAAPAATAQKAGTVAVSAPNEFPIVKDKVTLSIAIPQISYVTDYENNKMTKYLENKTNVKLKFELLPEKEYKDKLNIMLNAGSSLPDMFVSCYFTNEAQVQFGTQKLLIPLNDLVEKNGFYLKQIFKEVEGSKQQMTAPDGNIYALANIATNFPNKLAQRFWVVKDFLDTLGMQKPTTTDELYNYLKAVKTKDPNKNGKADEVPLTGSTTGWWQNVEGFIMNAFVYDNANQTGDKNNPANRLILENDKIRPSYTDPEFKTGLIYLNKLFKEGLLDPTALTQDEAQLRQLVETKDAIVVGAVAGGGNHNFANATGERRTHYVTIKPIKGPKGAQNTMFEKYRDVQVGMFAISKDCKYPEVAIKWADYNCSPEMHTWGRYGEPGVDWTVPEAGKVAVNGGPAKYKEILKWGSPQASHWGANRFYWGRFASDAREKSDDPFELEYVLYTAAKDYEPYAPKQVVPPFFFNVEESKKYTEQKKVINDYVNESIARFISGDLDIEKGWDAFIKELDKMGLKDYIDLQQKAYDRQWKGK